MRRTRRWTMNSRTLINSIHGDDSNLFGIRALEAGYNGGIVQARSIPRQSSFMRMNRLSQIQKTRSTSNMERLRLVSPAARPPLQIGSPILSVDLGNLEMLQAINAEKSQVNTANDSDDRRQSFYGPSSIRASALEDFAKQLHDPANITAESHDPDQVTSSLFPELKITRRSSMPRLPSITFDHPRRRLSMPASLTSSRHSRASRSSWHRLSDDVTDLHGAAEYGNRYRVNETLRRKGSRAVENRLLESHPTSLFTLPIERSSGLSNHTQSSFQSSTGHSSAFYGYTTADQTTWDGMSFGGFSPVHLFKRPPRLTSPTMRTPSPLAIISSSSPSTL